MFKNVASQKLAVYVFDSTTNLPKIGDAANLTAYVDKDWAGVNVLADTSATEIDSTNAKGYYQFDLAQAETNGDALLFTCKSSTANMVCLAMPALVYTTPPNFTSQAISSAGGVTLADGVSHGGTLGSSTATLALSRLNVTSQTSNTNAVTVLGNGTGHGASFTSGSGATGDAIRATAASTNGNGAQFLGAGTQSGLIATGGATGAGVSAVGGATSGDGFSATGGTSGHGIRAVGVGANDGIHATGGTDSYGIRSEGTGTGSGILAASGSGATGNGIVAQALSSNGSGLSLVSTGTGSGLLADKITASGAVAFGSTFAVAGTVTFNDFTVTNAFTVSGATTLTGAVTASNASNNIVGISIATGGIAEASFATTAGSFAPLGIIDQGTAQSTTSTTVVLRAAAAFGDDTLYGATIAVKGSTQGYWQERQILSNVGSTDTVTVDAFAVTPTGTLTYMIFATPPPIAAVPDVNIFSVNGIQVDGSGTTGDPWGPV